MCGTIPGMLRAATIERVGSSGSSGGSGGSGGSSSGGGDGGDGEQPQKQPPPQTAHPPDGAHAMKVRELVAHCRGLATEQLELQRKCGSLQEKYNRMEVNALEEREAKEQLEEERDQLAEEVDAEDCRRHVEVRVRNDGANQDGEEDGARDPGHRL